MPSKNRRITFADFLGEDYSIFDDGHLVISRLHFDKQEALAKFNMDRCNYNEEKIKEGWVRFQFMDFHEGTPMWQLYETHEKPHKAAKPVWYISNF